MGFKDLFFVSDDENKKETKEENVQQTFKSKFPSSGPVETVTKNTTVTSAPITPDNPACVPHLDKIMGLYESGFDGLNMEGYDFYEYFKMVVEAGPNSPTAYTMAFTMGKTAGATKDSLLSQADFYITEINKVHQHYVDNGTKRREAALKSKGTDESSLNNELTEINNEIARLNVLKGQKEAELAAIDGKYSPQITEVECKLMANDIARERILASITTVVNGIKTNL